MDNTKTIDSMECFAEAAGIADAMLELGHRPADTLALLTTVAGMVINSLTPASARESILDVHSNGIKAFFPILDTMYAVYEAEQQNAEPEQEKPTLNG